MNETEFLELPVRERDALVAEKVMGFKFLFERRGDYELAVFVDPRRRQHTRTNGPRYTPTGGLEAARRGFYGDLDRFTTDIAAAWEVVESLHDRGLYTSMSKDPSMGTWDVRGWNDKTNSNRFIAHADTAPLTICLAALKAVEFIK